MKKHVFIYGVLLTLIIGLPTVGASAATIAPPKKPHAKTHRVTESPATQKKMARMKHSTRTTAANNRSNRRPRVHRRQAKEKILRALLRQFVCRQSSGRRHHGW